MIYTRFWGIAVVLGFWLAPAWGQESSAVKRGEYIFRATGGCTCHTDVERKGAFMAGGRPIATPFGKIYSTNITPDPETGIGNWSDEAFINAMTHGVGPQGTRYFPAFPYTSFTRMTRQDLLDLKAYLFSIPPVVQENKPVDIMLPFRWRFSMVVWNWLFLRPGPFQPDPNQSAEWNRGAYLATAMGHCVECHTPRNLMGGLNRSMAYAGTEDGPEGELAANITPDENTGIGSWSIADIVWLLQTGFDPDGDDVQGMMSEVIENGYKHLTEADLRAIAVYIRSVPPISNKLEAKGESRQKSP
ncbi:MAG TPA: cytochrome c [Candidatus Entotheonella sp.]